MKLMRRREPITDDGYPDYFDDRHKRKMLKLADVRPSDVFYDLGCGDASILILAVREFDVKTAIGYESNVYRVRIARFKVKKREPCRQNFYRLRRYVQSRSQQG
jgi:ubiquinone/menaquinone biosynthesis C-methylase UbiE